MAAGSLGLFFALQVFMINAVITSANLDRNEQTVFKQHISELHVLSGDPKLKMVCDGNPTNKIRGSDPGGDGSYGACRSGCSRRHKGIDVICPANAHVHAPISGIISHSFPYGHPSAGQKKINDGVRIIPTSGPALTLWYVHPTVPFGSHVTAGQVIGVHPSVHLAYGNAMTDHVHLQLWVGHSNPDPTLSFGNLAIGK